MIEKKKNLVKRERNSLADKANPLIAGKIISRPSK